MSEPEEYGPLGSAMGTDNSDFLSGFRSSSKFRISLGLDPWGSTPVSAMKTSQPRLLDMAGSVLVDQLDSSSHLASSAVFDRSMIPQQSTSSLPPLSDYNPYRGSIVAATNQTSPASTSTGSTSIEAHDPWMNQTPEELPQSLDEASDGFNASSTPPAPTKRHVEFGGVTTFEEEPRRYHYQNGSSGTTKLTPLVNYEATAHPVKVTLAAEKGGVVFKHVNFILECSVPPSQVTRRYSDFVWLLDVLVKRYPFRSLPSLPPKKVNAQSDEAFLERRRRGLARFATFVMNHPRLKEDETIKAFFQYGADIASYRKAHNQPIDEEYVDADFGEPEYNSLPNDLDDRLASLKGNLDFLSNQYKELCVLMERISRRGDGSAVDFMRYGFVLNQLTERPDCQKPECYNCPQINHGFSRISESLHRISRLMEEEAQTTFDGVMEDLKGHRDLIVSLQELFNRRDKAIVTQGQLMDNLKKRINQNDAKVKEWLVRGGGQKEVERLEGAITQDRHELEWQTRKIDFIRFCLCQELVFYHARKAFVSSLYQGYVAHQITYTERMLVTWQALQNDTVNLPTSGF